jgi:hypothetical protein
MPARHRHQHSSERRKAFTITLESVFAFAWNRRSRCAGNRVHVRPESSFKGIRNSKAEFSIPIARSTLQPLLANASQWGSSCGGTQ